MGSVFPGKSLLVDSLQISTKVHNVSDKFISHWKVFRALNLKIWSWLDQTIHYFSYRWDLYFSLFFSFRWDHYFFIQTIHYFFIQTIHYFFVTDEITASFRRFGPLVVDWPHKVGCNFFFCKYFTVIYFGWKYFTVICWVKILYGYLFWVKMYFLFGGFSHFTFSTGWK